MNLSKLTLVAYCLLLASAAKASVTIHFDDAFVTGFPDGLANASGTPTNGMQWGVIISTTNGTFAGGGTAYDEYTAGAGTAGFLSYGGVVTDDYYVPGGLTATPSSSYNFADGGFTAGAGSIIAPITIPFGGNGISATDVFSLIWYGSAGNTSTAGSKYGLFTDPSFVVGSDGGDPTFGDLFAGTDPIRTASNTFQAIPEPSRVLFLALGCMGFLVRRRRV